MSTMHKVPSCSYSFVVRAFPSLTRHFSVVHTRGAQLSAKLLSGECD